MTENALSGDTDSLPIRLQINAIDNSQSSDVLPKNQIANINRTQTSSSNMKTPMRVQVEYPDNISRKRRHSNIMPPDGECSQKKSNSDNLISVIEQFREECQEDDALLSQVADFQIDDEPADSCADNYGNHSLGLSDTGQIFARCYTLPVKKPSKKGKVIVYDSDGLGGDSD